MAATRSAKRPWTDGRVLASVSMPLEGVEPGALLRLGEGGPRGFWAREGRWIAHIGAVATLETESDATVEPGSVVEGEWSADHRPDGRFTRIRESARELAASWRENSDPGREPKPTRWFGGFSFRSDHVAEGIWEGFPSAHFLLPAVELIGGDEGGVVSLKALRESPGDPDSGLKEELRATVKRLTDMSLPPRPKGNLSPPTLNRSDAGAWWTTVRRALTAVSSGGLSKVVLARMLAASCPGPVDPVDVVMGLWRGNPGSHVFLYEPRPGRVFLGAAPETIATVSQEVFRATAVAGSIARGESPGEQRALAEALLSSEKDRREHRVCVEDMIPRLSEIAHDVHGDPEPHVLTLAGIQHLESVITARLRSGETVLSALEALHPTPAVCGFPRAEALAFLAAEEALLRGWYAGPVGWFDSEGDGVFVPALRSAVGLGREWRLFAGAGIVAGSDPEREWAETRIKFEPVLKALSGEGDSWSWAPEGTSARKGRPA